MVSFQIRNLVSFEAFVLYAVAVFSIISLSTISTCPYYPYVGKYKMASEYLVICGAISCAAVAILLFLLLFSVHPPWHPVSTLVNTAIISVLYIIAASVWAYYNQSIDWDWDFHKSCKTQNVVGVFFGFSAVISWTFHSVFVLIHRS